VATVVVTSPARGGAGIDGDGAGAQRLGADRVAVAVTFAFALIVTAPFVTPAEMPKPLGLVLRTVSPLVMVTLPCRRHCR